ncbi:MAG: aminotransferase class IV, partial [Steroidobacteraceae bacterium]
MSQPATLIDGRPGDQVSVAERALHYGDGLFETISCVNGMPRWLPQHLERLRWGCERLQLPFAEYAALTQEIATLAGAGAGAAVADSGGPSARARCLVKV